MNSPYDKTLTLIHDAIKCARAQDSTEIDGDSAFNFMKGYVRALTDHNIITHEESQTLRKELLKIPS